MKRLIIFALTLAWAVIAYAEDSTFIFLETNELGYKEYLNPKDSSIIIEIPADSFIMGSNDLSKNEKPMHTVYLDKYYIGKYEVTVRQFHKFVSATGYKTKAETSCVVNNYIKGVIRQKLDATWNKPYFNQTDKNPVVCVGWNDAKAYCDWAGLRLPTEAEWERAARGTDGRIYPWGNKWDGKECNHGLNPSNYSPPSIDGNDGFDYTSPVGSYSTGVSPYGVYDMAGNVFEFCNDWYGKDYYGNSPLYNPSGPSFGTGRVLRGGCWGSDSSGCHSAARYCYYYDGRFYNHGFRVAK